MDVVKHGVKQAAYYVGVVVVFVGDAGPSVSVLGLPGALGDKTGWFPCRAALPC